MACLQPSWFPSINSTCSISSKSIIFSSRNQSLKTFRVCFSLNTSDDSSNSNPSSSNSAENVPEVEQQGRIDPVKLAFVKALAYKKSTQSESTEKVDRIVVDKSVSGSGDVQGGRSDEIPVYKKKEGIPVGGNAGENSPTFSGSNARSDGNSGKGKKEELTISSIDFIGLDFSDKKKSRGMPAGLVPFSDPFPQGDLPEVEFILGDTSKFQDATQVKAEPSQDETPDLYKPKVSTWGVFPRPGNISQTFGGGRTIRPGDVLETAEDRAAKEERTRQLIAAYKKKVGLDIDVKLKSECEKALKDGDSLMDSGKLKEALPYYVKVMDKLAFQTELHGLAALQWSICQDSLRRPDEARIMYEKLLTHPVVKVNKKARQFMFSFQAMDMLKFKRTTLSANNTGYQNYFDAFIEDKSKYSQEEAQVEDGAVSQVLPYVLLLVSPIFIILFIAFQKGNI